MKLKIRLTDSQDWSILNQLYADMDQKAPLADHRVQEIFTEISQIPNYHIYLAELDYEPVGTFSLLYVPTMMHLGYHRFAILDAVTVISSLRGQGIGTEMVRFALEQSAVAGCYKVTLSSNLKRDNAHRFYQSLGFEQHGWSFNCVVQPDIKQDGLAVG
ncbi:GNAT family N-acetyltransferase [Cylindrospermopsis raciborskii S07]|uniref:Acetyltransferase n=1 Tax=Cylindrospermopsis raciborskii CS-505 TaxID=533240 RepID=A0A853MEF9_9CYAN|nr:GNAT family N-acetyltransferase [Cylindrospermopsis raciborskii]EFA68147.1 hypothetical protein CRC_03407 [Cylindrospermopsis raciborskii CS-505]OBU75538.1 acetyltransferase [Cylindrospermopsis raciborskii CS-505]PNK04735.1 GNAT family N-acetyltransferase [Cylindrospermopsis raciborskii S14]PNK04892.1 GNAT family N-acetyltransferase [Cylindrospermopsis raciborskii S10]PNK09852.1 GNAT family N-acetyltransferase [Cylindrospermopsis raciborskii S06]